jgi:hypothetical protein
MKMKTLRITLLCILTIVSINVKALPVDRVVDGILYSIDSSDMTAEVEDPCGRVGGNDWNLFYSGMVNIPSTITYEGETYTVTQILHDAFRGQKNLTGVVIPKTVKKIDYEAFQGCTNLATVVFASNGVLESIERRAFYGCAITSLNFPNSLTYVGEDAFHDCERLKSIKGGANIEIFDDNVFQGCISLTEVTFPQSLKTLGNLAFLNCESLMTVTMNEGLETIGHEAFRQCKVLDNVIIPNTVKEIGFEAFRWCINLTSIELPNSVEKIGYGAFRYCTWLRSVKLSESLKEIPGWAFEQTAITSIEIPNSVKKIMPYAFQLCANLTDITWGNSLESIGDEAFLQTNIERLILPEPLFEIGGGAFGKCENLTEVTIPSTTTRISDAAFAECPQLKTVNILSTVPPVIPYNNCPFQLCDNPVEIHVYEGLKETYESNIGYEVNLVTQTDGTPGYGFMIIIDDLPLEQATSITIDNAPIYCEVGEMGQATATVQPANAFSHDFRWYSSDESILHIEEITGQYIGLEEGTVTITVSTTDGSNLQATATVYVGEVDNRTQQTISLNAIPSMTYGDEAYTLPLQTTQGQTLIWSSSDNNVAAVNGNTLSIRGAGTTTITATQEGNSDYLPFTKEYTLTVAKTSLTITATSYTIQQGDELPSFEASYSGFKNDEDPSVLTTQPTFGCSATSSSEPGTYDITVSGAEAANYDISYANGILTIEEKNPTPSSIITFADDAVKTICVANWDTDGDGELSMDEAAAVTSLGTVFKNKSNITSFDELQYFTGLTSIGIQTFSYCTGLTSVTIPASVTSIDGWAFEHCTGLTSVTIPNSVTDIGTSAFWYCNGLTTITIPNSVTSIGKNAFNNCIGLTSVTIPNGVTSIGEGAFSECWGLASITIPNSVTSIEKYTFGGCTSLTSITVEWEEPLSVPNNTFNSVPLAQATLYVPCGTKAAYQAADIWKDFGNIVDSEMVELAENGNMEEEQSEDWTSFWVFEWRTMDERFEGPANIVEDPKDAGNHCAKVVVRSQAEAMEAGNMTDDGEGNFASWDSQFFIQSKVKIESGKKLRLIMRVRADKPASIDTQAHQTPGDYNHWELFGGIDVSTIWKTIVKEVVITPDMTQENNGKEMRSVAFNLATTPDGNVFYFDDIKLEVMDNVQDITILPWGVDQPWEAKYVNDDSNATEDANGNPWYAVNYDDTSWNTLTGPIERSNSQWFSQSFFNWEPECSPIYMRRTFALNAIPNGNIIIKAIVDDNMQVYLNGEKIPCISLEDFEKVYLVPQSVLRVGDNVLALLATDEGGGEARCDYGMFVTDNLSYYIDEQGVVYYFEPIGEGAQRCVVYGLTMDHSTDIVITDEVLGTPVTCIRANAFLESDIAAVTIPASVTEIGESAFFGCRALSSITVEWDNPLAVPENVFDDRTYDEATLHTPGGHENYDTADVWKYFIWNGYYAHRLLLELIERMEGASDDHVYELDDAKAVANNIDATKEDCEGSITQLQQQIKDRCADAEENDLPVDASGLITNPSFSFNNNLYWKGDTPPFITWNNAEFYETTFDIHQELTGLPNGRYLLKVKGFHCPGTNEDVYNDYQQGINNASAQLYANGESVTLNNQAAFAQDEMLEWCGIDVSHDGVTQYVPNNMHDAYMWFSKGYYENELPVNITDGTLTLGIRLDESAAWGRVIFDDFRLEYLGESDHLYVDATEGTVDIYQGKTAKVNLNLDNEETILALEFSMSLPEGISIAKTKKDKEEVWDYTINSERSNGHELSVEDNGNGLYHFICHEGSGNALKGNIGELLSIRLICDKEMETGYYQATLSNIQFTDISRNTIYAKNQTFDINVSYLLDGDVNGDGNVNVTDLILMIDYIMERDMGNVNFNLYAADHNNDGKIRVIDVVEQVNLIFEFMNNNTSANSFDSFSSGLSLVNGKDGAVHVSLSDDAQYIASQFIVTLSDGQVLSDVKADNGHDVRIEQLSDNRYFVICYSMDNAAFRTKDQTLTLRVEGHGDVAVEEPAFVDTNKNLVLFQDAHTETTGIDTTLGDPTSPTDIYSINGQVVRKNATTTDGLNRGVYIVNGKKHSKK